jgi:signal transduction histidine kinase
LESQEAVGSNLNLSLCKSLIEEQMGGEVSIECYEGVGTTTVIEMSTKAQV